MPLKEFGHCHVSYDGVSLYDGKAIPPKVGWASIGSVSPARAEGFAKSLQKAIAFCRKKNKVSK